MSATISHRLEWLVLALAITFASHAIPDWGSRLLQLNLPRPLLQEIYQTLGFQNLFLNGVALPVAVAVSGDRRYVTMALSPIWTVEVTNGGGGGFGGGGGGFGGGGAGGGGFLMGGGGGGGNLGGVGGNLGGGPGGRP